MKIRNTGKKKKVKVMVQGSGPANYVINTKHSHSTIIDQVLTDEIWEPVDLGFVLNAILKFMDCRVMRFNKNLKKKNANSYTVN